MLTLPSAPMVPRPQPQFRDGPRGLEAVPPDERCACGQRQWLQVGCTWQCSTCWSTAQTPAPSAAERAAVAEGRRQGLAAVAEAREAEARADRARVFARTRDRRPLAPIREAWRALLLHRASPTRYPLPPAAREWRDHPLLDLVAADCELSGVDPQPLGRSGLARRALVRGTYALTRVAGFQGTGDFPGLLDGVAHTLFLDAYGDTVRSFARWTTAVTVPDFRSTIGSVVVFPELREVPEHAEYVAGSPFGPAVPVRLTNFGRLVQYTRAAALRDDVAAFAQLQQAVGVAAAAVENDTVYDLLASNPVLADGFALFSTQHANLMPAKALDATSLAAACAALATNSNHGRPAFLLVGTADGPTARQLITQETPPNAGDAAGVLEVVQDDRIVGAFYVTCDPAERPTVAVAHLAGLDGPELLSQDLWDVDARGYKGRDAFGAAVVSASSMVKTPTV